MQKSVKKRASMKFHYDLADLEEKMIGDKNLMHFTVRNKLKISGTFIEKRAGRMWTREGTLVTTKIEIDCIIKDPKITIRDVTTINKVDVYSDHRFLSPTVELDRRMERKRLVQGRQKRINYQILKKGKSKFQLLLKNRFKVLDGAENDIERIN